MTDVTVALAVALPVLAVATALAVACAVKRKQVVDWVDRKTIYARGRRPMVGMGFLRGNFRPTDIESSRGPLSVKGRIPEGLSGVFLRNGPNPFFKPRGDYHWFDGDGMVHAVRIKGSQVFYSNSWVRTSRLKQEIEYGAPAFMKIGELSGWKGLCSLMAEHFKRMLGILDLSLGSGQANTSIVFHARKLMALHEMDMPYSLRVLCEGAVETLGRVTFGTDEFKHFTAHPKVDPDSGEMHFFSYNLNKAPFLRYGVVGPGGELQKVVPIDVPAGPVMMHDMALTKNHVILLYMPLFFRPMEMIHGAGFPFVYDSDQPSRFAVLPRSGAGQAQVQWFELPASMIFHAANAWDGPDGEVHLFVCSTADYSLQLIASKSSQFREYHGARISRESKSSSDLPRNGSRRKKGMYMPGAHGGLSLMRGVARDPSPGAAELLTQTSMGSLGLGYPTTPTAPAGFGITSKSMFDRTGLELAESQGSVAADGSTSTVSPSIEVPIISDKQRSSQRLANPADTEIEHAFSLQHIRLDTRTGSADQVRVFDPKSYDAQLVEFPVINPQYACRPNRFVYLATFSDGMKADGVMKVDLQAAGDPVVGRIRFGFGRFGGEATFVPAKEATTEDDGFLLCFVWDSATDMSSFMIFNARTMAEGAMAEVDLKCRVPFGFHALFLTEDEFQAQLRDSARREEQGEPSEA